MVEINERVREAVEASCAAQGVPLRATEPTTLRTVAALLRVRIGRAA